MEIKGKHIYGLGAAVAGGAALLFALLYWFINRQLDSTVQAGLAIGLVGLAVFAWLEVDWLTRLLKTRQVRYGAESLVYIVMVLVVVGLLNFIFTQDRFKTRWDLTEDKQFTLAQETLNVLGTLTENVKIFAFYAPTSFGREDAENLLKNYSEKSGGKVEYEFVDPYLKPALAQAFGVTRDGQMVATRGDRREEVQNSNESDLTNAIVRLSDTTSRTVYFVTGHGEASPEETGAEGYSNLKSYLEGVNIQVKTLNVLADTVPVDASAIIIAGPKRPYAQSEVDLLARYLNGGGKLVVLAEPSNLQGLEPGQADPLANYLGSSWGIVLRDDFVVAPTYSSQGVDPQTVNYGSTQVTEGLQNINSLFYITRSIEIANPAPAEVVVSPVVSTMPDAWSETNIGVLAGEELEIQPDQHEPSGELVLAALGENTTTRGRVIVFGDSDFAKNQLFLEPQLGNGLIILNAVKWSTSKEDTINLTPRNTTSRSLNIFSTRDITIVFLLACVLPPLVVIGFGVSVWWSRRKG